MFYIVRVWVVWTKLLPFINPLPWPLWDSKVSIECTLQNPGESSRSTRYFFTYRLSNTMNFEHDTVVCVLCSRKVFDFRHSICLTSFFTLICLSIHKVATLNRPIISGKGGGGCTHMDGMKQRLKLSSLTQPKVVRNLNAFLSSAEYKRWYFEECW